MGCLATAALRFELQKRHPYPASLHWTDVERKQGPQKTCTSDYQTPSRQVTPLPEARLASGKFLLLDYREGKSIPLLHSLGFCFLNLPGLAIKSMVSQGHGAQKDSELWAVQLWPSLAQNSAPTSASLGIFLGISRALQTLPPEGPSVDLKNVLTKLTHRPFCTPFVFYFPSHIVPAITGYTSPCGWSHG